MTPSSSLIENLPDHDPSSLKMALRSDTLTKLWMLDNVDKVYNTLFAMKDMERNMMNGVLAQKWLTQTPLTDGKMRMGQRFETHSIFSSGEGCKPDPTDLRHHNKTTQMTMPNMAVQKHTS